jgi:hypothetical protein
MPNTTSSDSGGAYSGADEVKKAKPEPVTPATSAENAKEGSDDEAAPDRSQLKPIVSAALRPEPPVGTPVQPDPLFLKAAQPYWRWLNQLLPRYRRLRGDIAVFAAKLDRRQLDLNGSPPGWLSNAKRLTAAAKAALEACSIDEGWKCLHAARREELFGMSNEELNAFAATLAEEAKDKQKFPEGSWRRAAIAREANDALNEKDHTKKAQILFVATRIRDERLENIYYHFNLARHQLIILSLALLSLLVSGLVLVFNHEIQVANFMKAWSGKEPPKFTELPLSYFGICLFGAMGATVSAIMSFAKAKPGDKIPERTANALVTFARPFVGASAALIVVFALQSGLIARPDTIWLPFVWVMAFAAGFSERLVMRAIEATEKFKG